MTYPEQMQATANMLMAHKADYKTLQHCTVGAVGPPEPQCLLTTLITSTLNISQLRLLDWQD